MEFEITAEQAALVRVADELLDQHGRPRSALDGGPCLDDAVWHRLAELGLVAMTLPAERGGAGASLFDQVLVAERIGYRTAAVPVLAPAVAALVLAASDNATLAGVAARGDQVVGAAISARSGIAALTASVGPDGWRVSGSLVDVLEGASLDVIVVAANAAAGSVWLAVDRSSPGVERRDQPSLDQTQRLGAWTFADAPADVVVPAGSRPDLAARAEQWATVLLAAQALGAAARALDVSVAYAKTRRQFGQPIGRYQAIKHRLVDMLLDTENARSAVYNAGWAFTDERSDAALAAHLAKAIGTENAVRVASEAIQVHGGIGNTWEHDCHLYLRRAKACALALGDPEYHFQRIADAVLDDAPDDASDGAPPGATELVAGVRRAS